MSIENSYTRQTNDQSSQIEQKSQIPANQEAPQPIENNTETQQDQKIQDLKKKLPLLIDAKLNQDQISALLFLQEKLDQNPDSSEESLQNTLDNELFEARKIINNKNTSTEDPDRKRFKTNLSRLINGPQNIQEQDSTNTKNQLNLTLSQVQDVLNKAQFEQSRVSNDESRISPKREQFLKNFNLKGQESSIKEKEDKVGRLTFEVFLDDISNSVFTLPENKDFNSLYTAWELYQIKTFSTKTVKEFEEALTSTTDNNEIFKKEVQAKVLEIQNDPSIPEDQKNALIEAENKKWIDKARRINGMLNRQELIIAALSHKTNKPAEYLKKIQTIGKIYYNNEKITVDGIGGSQTREIIKELLNNFANHPHYNLIEKNLREELNKIKLPNTHKKKPLELKAETNAFDTQPVKTAYQETAQKNKNPEGTPRSPQNSDEAKKLLTEQSFQNISNEVLESSVPKEELEKAIKAFVEKIHQQFQNHGDEYQETEEYKKLGQKGLERAIKNGDISTPFLKMLNQQREKSPEKQQLNSAHKEFITKTLRDNAAEAVIHTGEKFLAKFGIQVTKKSEVRQENGRYYYMIEGNNGMTYYYRPETGNISTKSFDSIDHQNQTLQLGEHTGYRIINHIPRFDELLQKAQNLNFLQGDNPNNIQELSKNIKDGIDSQIDYTIGELEKNTVAEIIEKEATKTELGKEINALLSDEPNAGEKKLGESKKISRQENPGLYQMLLPIVNTLPHATLTELTQLKSLTKTLKDNHDLTKSNQQKINVNIEKMTSLSDIPLSTPQELFALITNPHEIQKISDPSKQEKKSDGTSQFSSGLGTLIKRCEKSAPGKSVEHNLLDIQKLVPLLQNPTDTTILQRSEYQSLISQIKENYRPQIEANAKEKDKKDANNAYQQTQKI